MAKLGDLAQIDAVAENDRIGVWDTSAPEGTRDKYASPQQVRNLLLDTANTWTEDQYFTGSLGIGTTSPAHTLHAKPPTARAEIALDSPATQLASVLFKNEGVTQWILASRILANTLYISASPAGEGASDIQAAAKIAVLQNGNVGIGTIGPSYRLDVSGDINASGSVRSNGTPLTSDERLKDDIEPLSDALAKVRQARGVSFAWKDDSNGEGKHIGFVAQEIEEIFPDLVSEWVVDGETIKCVDYARMVPALLEAVKELAERIDNLDSTSPVKEK